MTQIAEFPQQKRGGSRQPRDSGHAEEADAYGPRRSVIDPKATVPIIPADPNPARKPSTPDPLLPKVVDIESDNSAENQRRQCFKYSDDGRYYHW